MTDALRQTPPDVFALGRQVTADYYDCDPAILADAPAMERLFIAAAKASGATVVDSVFHLFEPQGVSGVVVISESHFAVHAWPEYDYAAVDIFTCGDSIDFDVAVSELAKGMRSRDWRVTPPLRRGVVADGAVSREGGTVPAEPGRTTLSWKKHFLNSGAASLVVGMDIYDCTRPDLQGDPGLQAFLQEFLPSLNLERRGRFCSYGDEQSFEQPLRQGRLFGRFDAGKRAVYLVLELTEFREPREAAEEAMRELGGKYYRIHPRLRP